MGGKASGEARRAKKTARETAQMILSCQATGDVREALTELGVPESDQNIQTAIMAGQAKLAGTPHMPGSTGASRLLLELSGELGETASEETNDKPFELPAEVIGSEWVDINRDLNRNKYAEYFCPGGRGSGKSSFWIGLKSVEFIEKDPTACVMIVKQYKVELRDSVYEQVKWALSELELEDNYKCTTNPMVIVKKSTGQKIFFMAGDNPGGIKSIKTPHGMTIKLVVCEEADQLRGMKAIRNITQSAFRGGNEGTLALLYNPPISARHWINVEERAQNPRRMVHKSNYLNVYPEWIGQKFLDDAAALKEVNPRAYEHEYMGIPTGTGATVFENLEIRKITKEERNGFDEYLCGLDFGYVDPTAFTVSHYDYRNQTLYIFKELGGQKLSSDAINTMLEDYKHHEIIADRDPSKIDDMRDYGYHVVGVHKGAVRKRGSREYSFQWLATLAKIVIDPVDCPNTAEEFQIYEFEQSKDGDILNSYPKENDHFIDSVRYACSRIWRTPGE